MNTLIDNVRLWTGENAIDDACIQIKDTRIAYAGARAAAPEFAADTTIDGKGGIALPGLVNAHTHLPMTLVRGVGTDLPLMDWLHKIWPLEDKLTPELMRIGTQMSCIEALRTGTTCFADAYMMSETIAQTVADAGMRLNICRMMTGETAPEKMAEQRALFSHFNGAAGDRVRVYIGLHAEYTSDESLVRDLASLAGELGTGLHVHVSETKSEVEECRARRNGRSPVRYLADCGRVRCARACGALRLGGRGRHGHTQAKECNTGAQPGQQSEAGQRHRAHRAYARKGYQRGAGHRRRGQQ